MLTRRSTLLAAASLRAPAAEEPVQPFRIHIRDAVLRDLRQRLARTRWPGQIPETGWKYGPDVTYIRQLCDYWRSKFDWRAQERRINAWPHFTTPIDGINLHFLHARSRHQQATPLVLVHGWPGSFVEFLRVIGPLTDPESHGGSAADAFHVVAPSLPGFGFSSAPREPGWTNLRMAAAVSVLMARIGYQRFGAQGGDWGGGIVRWLAGNDDQCIGAHSNFPPYPAPPGGASDGATLAELQRAQRRIDELADHKAYGLIQGTRPLALGYGLNDSPAGLAAWILDKFRVWSDHGGKLENSFSTDDLLANITLYWVTATMPSAMRIYYETQHSTTSSAASPFPTRRNKPAPMGYALFPKEINLTPRAWVERAVPNVIHWTEMPRGGHFAAMEQPEALVRDVRAFFAKVRAAGVLA